MTRTLLSAAAAMLMASPATPATAISSDVTHVPCATGALRAAIAAANVHGGTLILTHNCVYHLNNTNGGPLSHITNRITIKGRDATIVRDSTAALFRIFEVEDPKGNLEAKDLTISGGMLDSGPKDYGAGIKVEPGASLRLIDSTVTDNTSATGGGGIGNFGRTIIVHSAVTKNRTTTTSRGGGGIYSDGSLTITKGSRLTSNSASSGGKGGALFTDGGTIKIDHATLSGNSAQEGGAFYGNNGTTELVDSTVTHNTATDTGGGLNNFNPPMIVRRTVISNNTAANGGGIDTDAWMALIGSQVTGNQANGTSTSSGEGGGIRNRYLMEIRDSHITKNQANNAGGGVYTTFTTDVSHTTVSGNAVAGSSGQGGGFWSDSSLVLDDVKVTGNRTATGSASRGGGIYNTMSTSDPGTGNLLLTKTKVTHNTSGDGGGVFTNTQFRVFKDSIIRHNHPNNCAGVSSGVNYCTG